MIRVVIVDDHPVARRGLEAILAEAGEFQVVASVARSVPAGRRR